MAAWTQTGTKFDIDGLYYTTLSDSTVQVTSDFLTYILDDTVTIPEWVSYEGRQYHVTSLEERAFSGQAWMTHVVIPPSIRTISTEAFYVSNLRSVSLPSTLDSIKSCAFQDTRLVDITIPASVRYVDEEAFYWVDSLQRIDVESGSRSYCSMDGILFSGDSTALYRYPSARTDTSFAVPHYVRRLGDDAFLNCIRLRRVSLPDGLREIGVGAFHGCQSLNALRLPGQVRLVSNPFAWCPVLTQFELDSTNPYYRIETSNWALLSTDGDTLFYKGLQEPIITVPEGVRCLAPYAFAYNFRCFEVHLPEGLEEIGDMAFLSNHNLEQVTVPSTLRRIGEYAFAYNRDLRSIALPEGLESIGKYSFFITSNMRSCLLPNSLKTIPEYAFANCRYLNELVLGDSIERIERGAFAYSDALDIGGIVFPPTLRYVGDEAFRRAYFESVEFTGQVDTIGALAFAVEGQKLKRLTLAQQTPPVTGEGAFNYAYNYKIHIPCGSLSNYLDAPVWDGYRNYEEDCDGVEPVDGEAVTVRGGAGQVVVAGTAGQRVEVYNVTGVRVTAGTATADPQAFRVPAAGIYLVRVADRTYKAAVR